MSRRGLIVLACCLALLAVWGATAALGSPEDPAAFTPAAPNAAAAAGAPGAILASPEISRTADSPAISFIDSPNPTCYRPVENTGVCYIQWNYLYVTASSGQYVISMTVAIDGDLRSYHSGFFQTYMYVPGDLYGPGFQMTCGMPGSGGIANLGMTYNYTIRARETGGLSAANYGAVTCPADVVTVYLPMTRKR